MPLRVSRSSIATEIKARPMKLKQKHKAGRANRKAENATIMTAESMMILFCVLMVLSLVRTSSNCFTTKNAVVEFFGFSMDVGVFSAGLPMVEKAKVSNAVTIKAASIAVAIFRENAPIAAPTVKAIHNWGILFIFSVRNAAMRAKADEAVRSERLKNIPASQMAKPVTKSGIAGTKRIFGAISLNKSCIWFIISNIKLVKRPKN